MPYSRDSPLSISVRAPVATSTLIDVGAAPAPRHLAAIRRVVAPDGDAAVRGRRHVAQRCRRRASRTCCSRRERPPGASPGAAARSWTICTDCGVASFQCQTSTLALFESGRRDLGFLLFDADEDARAVLAPARRGVLAQHHSLRERRVLRRIVGRSLSASAAATPCHASSTFSFCFMPRTLSPRSTARLTPSSLHVSWS